MINAKEQIIKYINENNNITVDKLSTVIHIKKRMIHYHLNTLINENKIIKIGIPPKVYYSVKKVALNENNELYDNNNIIIKHDDLFKKNIDIKSSDIIIGINEPAFKKSNTKMLIADLDSPLNARLITYFLPAVQIARMQSKRPRLIIITGINVALKYNSNNEHQRKIMYRNNILKLQFIDDTLKYFFPDVFSIVEIRQTFDFMKITENKLDELWEISEKRYPEKIKILKDKLIQFSNINGQNENNIKNAFRYAIIHLFALGDINIDNDFIHNNSGYCSIGEHQELYFNTIRNIGYDILKDIGEIFFEREVHCYKNLKIIIEDEGHVPPPYNGSFRSSRDKTFLDEVTFENSKPLSYYDDRPRLKPHMDYLYKIIPKDKYNEYWKNYKDKYLKLKKRYNEAYNINTPI